MATYHAQFNGRQLGAIGIFYRCSTFVDGVDKDAARLALYDRYEHIQGLTLVELPIRFAPVTPAGCLMVPAQGHRMFETPEAARKWLDAVIANNHPDTLRQVYGAVDGFRVEPVPCWPGHFDPTRTVFEPALGR